MLAGIVATPPIYADESETETNIKCKGDNNAGGEAQTANVVDCTINPPF